MSANRALWATVTAATVGVGISLAAASTAQAKILFLWTMTGGTYSGTFDSGTASGTWTTGTTLADFTSNITVTENFPGGPNLSYDFTSPNTSGHWSAPSQAPGAPGGWIAEFGLTPYSAGSVSISLNDFVYGGSGSATVTMTPYTSVPEPAIWMTMALGVAGLGAALRGSRRRRIAKPA
jgi:hypothetical protein